MFDFFELSLIYLLKNIFFDQHTSSQARNVTQLKSKKIRQTRHQYIERVENKLRNLTYLRAIVPHTTFIRINNESIPPHHIAIILVILIPILVFTHRCTNTYITLTEETVEET